MDISLELNNLISLHIHKYIHKCSVLIERLTQDERDKITGTMVL